MPWPDFFATLLATLVGVFVAQMIAVSVQGHRERRDRNSARLADALELDQLMVELYAGMDNLDWGLRKAIESIERGGYYEPVPLGKDAEELVPSVLRSDIPADLRASVPFAIEFAQSFLKVFRLGVNRFVRRHKAPSPEDWRVFIVQSPMPFLLEDAPSAWNDLQEAMGAVADFVCIELSDRIHRLRSYAPPWWIRWALHPVAEPDVA